MDVNNLQITDLRKWEPAHWMYNFMVDSFLTLYEVIAPSLPPHRIRLLWSAHRTSYPRLVLETISRDPRDGSVDIVCNRQELLMTILEPVSLGGHVSQLRLTVNDEGKVEGLKDVDLQLLFDHLDKVRG